MNERTFTGSIERLQRPERLAALEVPRVVGLCLDGVAATTLLDVGCGSGIFAGTFCGRGLFCTGLDLNEGMLRATREAAPATRVAQAAAENLPFTDASFDMAFMAHVLHEVDDPAIALAECARVARRRVAVLEWPYEEGTMGPPLAHRLKPEDVAAAGKRAGLVTITPVVLKSVVLYLMDL